MSDTDDGDSAVGDAATADGGASTADGDASAADSDTIAADGNAAAADGGAQPADEQSSDSERVQVTGSGGYAVNPAEREPDEEFGWRGYVLLGVLVIAFVVAPIVVFLRPPALPRYVSLILFPLLPAVALGVVAVWSAAQS